MIEQSDKIIKAVDESLIKMRKALNKVTLKPIYNVTVNSFNFSSEEGLNKLLIDVPLSDNPVIYRIVCENLKQRTHLLKIYKKFHTENRKRILRVDRINMARLNGTDSSTLYVGSTRCLKSIDFRNRVKQHLGAGNFRTYALQLSKWHLDLNYEIKIEAINIVTNYKECLTKELVELIEQTFWEYYKPVFGKKAGL